MLDQSKTTGATAAVTWEPTSAITTSVVWFFSHNWDRTTNYSNKVAFNGGGATTNNTAGQTSPGAPGIDADLPYTIDANGVVQSGDVLSARWRNGDPRPGQQLGCQESPMAHEL